MEEEQKDDENDFIEQEKLLAELKKQSDEAREIFELLNGLVNDGAVHRELFQDLYTEIQTSQEDISTTKGLNTKYRKELEKRGEEVETLLSKVEGQQESFNSVAKNIKEIEDKVSRKKKNIEKLRNEANESKKEVTRARSKALKLLEKLKRNADKSTDLFEKFKREKEESIKILANITKAEEKIDRIHNRINNKNSDLFDKEGSGESKIERLDKNIKEINSFHEELKGEIKDDLKSNQEYLSDLREGIEDKRVEIDSLLSNTTVRKLAEGYLESMHEYSKGKELEYEWEVLRKDIRMGSVLEFPLNLIQNLCRLIYNSVIRYFGDILNYALFVLPLVAIVSVWFFPKYLENILDIFKKAEVVISLRDIFLLKISLSLPLLWISWFGQRSISQKKRLFEEYNHKLRVVQMYLMFTDDKNSYRLKEKLNLEKILIDVIADKPSKCLDKSETILDRLLDKIRIEDFFKRIKRELMDEVAGILKSDKKSG